MYEMYDIYDGILYRAELRSSMTMTDRSLAYLAPQPLFTTICKYLYYIPIFPKLRIRSSTVAPVGSLLFLFRADKPLMLMHST